MTSKCTASGVKTADASIMAGAGVFHGIIVSTDGTNAVTVKFYDNTAASGTKFLPDWTVTTGSADRAQAIGASPPIEITTGIYIDITCAGTVSYTVLYNRP